MWQMEIARQPTGSKGSWSFLGSPPGFIPWRRECPVLLGTGVDASLGEAQMGRDDENHYQDSVSFPDGPYPLFVWGRVLEVKGKCLTKLLPI